METKKKKLWNLLVNFLLFAVLAFYIVLLVVILFHRRQTERGVNLIPLLGILSYLSGRDLVSGTADPALLRGMASSNLLGNIVIFIPLGVYITLFCKDKRIWKNTLMTVIISMAAEAAQFAFKLGTADIDDVILNGLGGLLGVLVCRGIFLLCKGDGFKARCTVAVLAPVAGICSFAVLILQN